MGNFNFSSEGVERNNSYEPIPNGDYPVIISESIFKHPKGPYGEADKSKPTYLELKVQIIDGEFKGRTVFDRLHLNNPSDTTRKIAKGTMAGILDSLGMTAINDSSELHNRPMMAKIVVKPASGEWSAGNEVKGYKPFVNFAPVQAVAQAAPVAGTKKPWEN